MKELKLKPMYEGHFDGKFFMIIKKSNFDDSKFRDLPIEYNAKISDKTCKVILHRVGFEMMLSEVPATMALQAFGTTKELPKLTGLSPDDLVRYFLFERGDFLCS